MNPRDIPILRREAKISECEGYFILGSITYYVYNSDNIFETVYDVFNSEIYRMIWLHPYSGCAIFDTNRGWDGFVSFNQERCTMKLIDDL